MGTFSTCAATVVSGINAVVSWNADGGKILVFLAGLPLCLFTVGGGSTVVADMESPQLVVLVFEMKSLKKVSND